MLHSKSLYSAIFICTFALQTSANSDDDIEKERKSGDMPASIVFLLLFIFTSLGFICIRHIKREYAQQQFYLLGKRAGSILNDSVPTKSYGSTFSPRLNASNIDEYIEDSLYGNNPIIERINQFRQIAYERFIDYMEGTPEPVLFEANPDKTVEAYCKNPEIPNNPNYEPQPLQHSTNYNPTPSPALQRMFDRNYQKNKQNKDDQINDDGVADIKEQNKNKNKKNKIKIINKFGVQSRMDNEQFNDYNCSDHNEYDVIPDDNHNKNRYSDSDQEISDTDIGGQNRNKNDQPLLTKVVILDLD